MVPTNDLHAVQFYTYEFPKWCEILNILTLIPAKSFDPFPEKSL